MDQGDTEDLSLSPASSQLDQVILEGEHQGDDLCDITQEKAIKRM